LHPNVKKGHFSDIERLYFFQIEPSVSPSSGAGGGHTSKRTASGGGRQCDAAVGERWGCCFGGERAGGSNPAVKYFSTPPVKVRYEPLCICALTRVTLRSSI
jgi:hypothetical protein